MGPRWSLRRALPGHASLIKLSVGVFGAGVALGAAIMAVGWVPTNATGSTATGAGEMLGLRNLLVTNGTVLAILVAGAGLFALPTLLTLFRNGVILGTMAGVAARSHELPTFIALIAPHGVVELSAFCLAVAAGLRLPVELVNYLRGKRSTVIRRSELRQMAVLTLFAAALVIIAAVIESTVTAWITRELH
jgi:uncharacterized membrane protein SpoIIM required for sporulation